MREEKKNAASNPQYERTHKAIIRTFCDLLNRKSFEAIIVQDILDETPVSRATFYKHFADKYEIAERLLEDYYASYKEVLAKLKNTERSRYPAVILDSIHGNEAQVAALLKIHTEKVDLQRSLEEQYQKLYLSASESPSRELEAQIYARAMAAYCLSCSPPVREKSSADYFDQVMIEVFLRIMSWEDSEEMRGYLKAHVVKA